jgi:DNA-binding SARP family transcriptional activator
MTDHLGVGSVRYRILGSLEVWQDGRQVPIGGRQPPAVLGTLLLNANRVVSVDRLADSLWGEQAPATARRLLHGCVAELRRALRTDRDGVPYQPLVTKPPGYQLDVQPGELDLDRFTELTAAARDALRSPGPGRGSPGPGSGSPGQAPPDALEAASALLREALALWRGPALDGVVLQGLSGELAALEERRLTALEERIDVDLRLGRHPQLVGELQLLVEAHPLRERLWRQLILALARAHRQADALAAYQQVRGVLVDQLGIEPGAPLRALHQSVLAGEEPFETEPAPVAAPPPVAQPPVTSPPSQLPRDVWGFVDRPAALAALDAALAQAEQQPTAMVVCALSGSAGVGKTSLAVHWAHRVADRFPDGQLYVNLRGYDQGGAAMVPAEAVREFLDALGVPADRIPASLDAQAALYRSTLAGKRVLVLIDNARDAEQTRPLLPGTPTAVVLVTSRNQLTPLVAADGAQPIALGLLDAAEARDLLARRLGAARVDAEPDAIAEIVERCARLPLALSIAAARAAVHPGFPLSVLAAELAEAHGRLDALTAGDQASDVRAVFSWSYRALSPAAARLFRLLGLHPGPDLSAAAMASLTGLPPGQTRPLLAELTSAGLLAEPAPGRYTLHDLLHAYAADLTVTADPDAERRAAVRRLLDHYVHGARAADRMLHPQRDEPDLPLDDPADGVTPEHPATEERATGWFAAERPVLLAAQRMAAGTVHAWQLAWALDTYLDRHAHWRDLEATWHAALAAADRLDEPLGLASAHRHLAWAYTLLDRRPDSHRHLAAALALYEQAGDLVGQTHVHVNLSVLWERDGRIDQALIHDREALALSRVTGHRRGLAQALNSLGWDHAQLGDPAQALVYCREALALHHEDGHRHGEASTWDSIGYAHRELGQHAESADAYWQAIELFRELGDRYNVADTLVNLGEAHRAADDMPAARRCWAEAMAIFAELDNPRAAAAQQRLAGRLEGAAR